MILYLTLRFSTTLQHKYRIKAHAEIQHERYFLFFVL